MNEFMYDYFCFIFLETNNITNSNSTPMPILLEESDVGGTL